MRSEPGAVAMVRSTGGLEIESVDLRVAKPTADNLLFPSLLGRDILGQYCLVVDRPSDEIWLD